MLKLPWMSYRPGESLICYASKIAQCAGLHPYAGQEELRGEVLKLLGKDDDFVSTEDRAREAISKLDVSTRRLVEGTMVESFSNAREIQDRLVEIEKTLETKEEGALIANALKSSMYTNHGNEKEGIIREKASTTLEKKIATSNKFVVSREPLFAVNGVEVYVGGRHDGMTEDSKIVEIKTRQRRFMGTPKYELVQIHAYMVMHGVREAILVESLNGEEKTHAVEFDEGLWADVKGQLEVFFRDVLIP